MTRLRITCHCYGCIAAERLFETAPWTTCARHTLLLCRLPMLRHHDNLYISSPDASLLSPPSEPFPAFCPSISHATAALQDLITVGYHFNLLSCYTPAEVGAGGHAANLLKGKWTWMSGTGVSKEGSFLLLTAFFFLHLLLNHHSFLLLPFPLSLRHYPFSLCHSHPQPVWTLSRSLRGFHLDLQTPPPGATLITYRGNRKCGLKSKLKWVFHYRLLIFWWQYQGSYFQNIFHQVCARHHFG